MFSLFIEALGIVFVFASLCFLCFWLFQNFCIDFKPYVLVDGRAGDENLPDAVCFSYMKINAFNLRKRSSVIVLDRGISESVRERCINCVPQGAVIFLRTDEFENIEDFLLKDSAV